MKKFSKYIEEMSMSVTLKPKKNNMYKVTGVGKKMAAHGGIKKGEKFHDSEIDGMHDSGIKVKYQKPKMKKEAMSPYIKIPKSDPEKEAQTKKEIETRTGHAKNFAKPKGKPGLYDAQGNKIRLSQTNRFKHYKTNEAIERRADRKTIIATDPATGRKVIKIAPKKEIDIGKGKMESVVNEISNDLANRVTKQRKINVGTAAMKADGDRRDPDYKKAQDKLKSNQSLKFKRGATQISKAVGEENVNEISDKTKVDYINKANKEITDKEKLHLKVGLSNVKDKSLEKRRKGVATAKSKLGEAMTPIGKSGRHDIHHTDTSDYNYHSSHASNVSHGGKGSEEAGEDQFHYKFKDHKIDVNDSQSKTKLSHVQQRVKASGVSPKHHDAVSKSIHKHITTESVMKMYELTISKMQKYKKDAYNDVQDGENARHKGYPEKDIDKRQDKRYKGIDTANKRIAKKQVKMATGVAFDKRYKGGNMTGASKAIDKIKPGLSNHPKVKDALRRANEEFKGE